MVQFNLLPDVKIEYIKTKYRKRLMMLVSGILSGVCFTVFIFLLLFVRVNQPKYIRDLNKDIKSNVSAIQGTQDLDKILTIQNQLNSLPALDDKRIITSRTLDYLVKVTPAAASISDISIDFSGSKMTIKGNTDTLVTVNKFVDTLKFTDYALNNESKTGGKAFKNVVLNNFGLPAPGDTSGAGYELSLEFDPALYAKVKDDKSLGQESVILTVPNIISTRSETEKPLFVAPTKTEEKKN